MNTALPTGWHWRRLGDLATEGPANGYSGPVAPDAEGTPTLRLSATTTGVMLLNAATTKRLVETIPDASDRWLSPGDLLVQRSNTPELVGTTAVYDGPEHAYVYPDLMMRMRFAEPSTTSWICRYMNSEAGRRFFRRMAGGSSGSMPKISGAKLRELTVPLPPLPEQRRIAAILDEADALRRKRRESLGLLDDLIRATFLDMFGDPVTNPRGWPVGTLAQAFEVPPRIGTTRPAHDGGAVRVVRVGEIGGPGVALHRCGMVSLPHEEFERYRTISGDFLLARAIGSEDLLGKGSVMQSVGEPVVFDSHVMRLRFAPSLMEPAFFQQWMLSPGGRQQFLRRAGRTAVQFNVNADQIAAVEIYQPPIGHQRAFKDMAQAATVERKAMDSNSVQVERLFSGLIHRAFSGEL